MEKGSSNSFACIGLASILLLGAFFVVTAGVVSAAQDGDYIYTVNNGNATIIGYTGAGGAITIPSTLGGYPMVAIGRNAFSNCASLTSITFLGFVAPTTVGPNWISGTPGGIRGHAYAISNFPAPGGVFHGLTMGANIPLTAPGAPTGLNATPGNAQISLNWTAPAFNGGSNIIGYNVYRSTSEIGNYTLIASTSGTTHTDTARTNGQTYRYNVSAVNIVGEGAKTAIVSSTPFTVPDAPTGLLAIFGNVQVTLNWTAPSFNGGSDIDYYVIYQDGVALPDHPIGLTTVITGLTNGQNYSFSVAAHNLAGIGARSSAASAIPRTVPGVPTGLTAVAGNAQVTLNWTAPASNGGSDITNYVVYRGTTSGGEILLVSLGNVLTYINTGLTNGQTYYYRVSAVNSIGEAPQSDEASATPATVPSAPRGLQALARDSMVHLNWTAPEYTGPGTLTYHLFRDASEIWSGTGWTYSDSSVTNGINYSYKVAASNSVGWGENCTAVIATPFGPPSAPRGLTAAVGNGSIELNWTAPQYTGPGNLTYHLFRDGLEIWNGTAIAYQDAPLTKGVQYSYTVAAQNSIGWGLNCSAVLATSVGVPDAPWGLSATSGDAQISLSWNAVNYSGPGNLTYYLFRDGESIWSGVVTTYEDIGLINGQTYEYKVAANNSVGWSPNSSSVSAMPQGPPTAPLGLVAQAGNGLVDLNWTAPSYPGPGILTYHLFRDGSEIWNGTGLGYADAGLTNFVSYSYTVAAQNSIGWGPNSIAVLVTPLPSEMVPTAPRNLTAVPGNENATLTWEEPTYSNSSAVTGYMIYYGTAPGSMPNQITWNQLVYVLDGLNKGVTYYFSVKAQNSAGWGNNSSIESTIPFGVPNEPTNLSAEPGNAQVTLSWSTPSYSGPGSLIHHLFRDGILVWSGNASSHIDAGLTNEQAYSYKVSTSNDVGWGPNSTEIQTTPSAMILPGAPSNFHVTAGNARVDLSWSPPTSSGSTPVTSYKIYRLTNSSTMALFATVTSGTGYTDTAVTNGQNYFYQIRASSSIGNGAGTEILSATPHAPGTPGSPNEDMAILVSIVTVLVVGAIAAIFYLKVAFFLRKGK